MRLIGFTKTILYYLYVLPKEIETFNNRYSSLLANLGGDENE